MTEQERINRGAEAKRLMENKVFLEAKEKFLKSLAQLRTEIGPRDQDGAVRLIQMEQTILKTFQHLQNFVVDGEMAAKELDKDVIPLHRRMARTLRA